MAEKTITGEVQFQVLAHSFAVSPSAEGYTLQYGVDGQNFTDWSEATPANENLVVNGIAKNMYFKLKGNNSTVIITY